MAGASIGALFATASDDDELNNDPKYHHWKAGLTDHLDLAIQLYDVKDIYIMEHRNCGAYKAFLKYDLGNYDKHGYAIEFAHHKKYAKRLTELLTTYLIEKKTETQDNTGSKYQDVIQIHSFMTDLTGDVELLHTTAPISEAEE